jgi:hypothetical protein
MYEIPQGDIPEGNTEVPHHNARTSDITVFSCTECGFDSTLLLIQRLLIYLNP